MLGSAINPPDWCLAGRRNAADTCGAMCVQLRCGVNNRLRDGVKAMSHGGALSVEVARDISKDSLA